MKYFLHDTSAFDDEKISMLFMEFGYEGLGLFYTVLEKLGKQEKTINTKVLKMQLKVGKKLEKCWKFMEEIELLSSNNGETFNKRLSNFNESVDIKREKTSKRVSEHRVNQKVTESVTHYNRDCNAPNLTKPNLTKLNLTKECIVADEKSATPTTVLEDVVFLEEKEKETKKLDLPEKEKKESPKVAPKGSLKFDAAFVDLPFSDDDFKNAWMDWVSHRKEIKKPLTSTMVKQQLAKLYTFGSSNATAMINRTIGKGWQGLVYELERPPFQNAFVNPSRDRVQDAIDTNEASALRIMSGESKAIDFFKLERY